MFRDLSCFLFFILFSVASHANIAFRQLHINESNSRDLNIAIWYPTAETGSPENVGDNIAFYGTSALRDAAPEAGEHPLLLLSHGYGGNWRNLNWLATEMAAQGYIVAAVDHPGTTTFNKRPQDAKELWRRPQDLQRVMVKIITTPSLAGKVDKQRIAAAGHSLGGWTVLELTGARFDAARFQNDCRTHTRLSACKLIQTLGIDDTAGLLAANEGDPAIKAVVSLDLGLARGFTPESLSQIAVPVLIMTAQADSDELPARLESGYLAEYIPAAVRRVVSVEGATHFSFMQQCKPGAIALIAEKEPGEEIVCQDGGTRSRDEIHRHLVRDISAFLHQTLDFQPLSGGNPSGLYR
ncbi:alpha/beta fold hydrolase (plasmid) [Klebsiella sp. CTHL.F3a]|uniref:alpha/beta hydrolase family protein n=1 Tax=Klebsiella sp. CTHL.F3a TaxID=2873296 RepID=UPI001CA7406E|nr:alpha/beta fold hydrolase [Klebsiella sp. CTHL.F3a]QZY83058.1 alpha/beta fold hydrolase [Klebsiella sp. CTHL.F3a]